MVWYRLFIRLLVKLRNQSSCGKQKKEEGNKTGNVMDVGEQK